MGIGKRLANQWTTKSGINQNVELKIELPTAKSCTTILLGISNATERMPKTFRIEASNDDLQWTVLYQDLDGSDLSLNTDYLYENPYKDVAFKYYRLYVISNRGGGHLSLRQFGLLNKTIVKEY